MKKILFTLAAVGLISSALAANRTQVAVDTSVAISHVHLYTTPDGGCAVRATASFSFLDGGSSSETSPVVEVSGANLTTCEDVRTKAKALFKSTQGF